MSSTGYESADGLGCGVAAPVGDVFYCISSTSKSLISESETVVVAKLRY
jgi:hypothetical protein